MRAYRPRGQRATVVAVSMYQDDIALLDALLDEAKNIRGYRLASRSEIMREALKQVNLGRVYPVTRRPWR